MEELLLSPSFFALRFIVGGAVFVLFLALYGAVHRKLDVFIVILALIAGTGGGAIAGLTQKELQESALTERQQAWVEDRGVSISETNWAALEFPILEELPTEEKTYGVTTAVVEDQVTQVSLSWEASEERFILRTTEGEELIEVDSDE